MTCHDALERLLIVDLAADGSVDDPALQSHLGRCAQCTTVAAQLRSDTRMLAAAVAAPRELRSPVAVPRRLWLAWPTLAMAAIAVFLVARTRPTGESGVMEATPAAVAETDADAPVRSEQTAARTRLGSRSAPKVVRRATPRGRMLETPRVVAAALGNDLRSAITPFTATPFVPERTIVATAAIETPQPINYAEAARAPVFSVDPMVGTRAMVARTADPRITVVWLY